MESRSSVAPTSTASQTTQSSPSVASTSHASTSPSHEAPQDVGVLVNPESVDIQPSGSRQESYTPISSRELKPLSAAEGQEPPVSLSSLPGTSKEQPDAGETSKLEEKLKEKHHDFLKGLRECDQQCKNDSNINKSARTFFSREPAIKSPIIS